MTRYCCRSCIQIEQILMVSGAVGFYFDDSPF
jgi:hypothetical protein